MKVLKRLWWRLRYAYWVRYYFTWPLLECWAVTAEASGKWSLSEDPKDAFATDWFGPI